MIKRYSVEVHNRMPTMVERGYGAWVKYDDYAEMQAELEQLRAVRDAAEELNFWNAGFGHSETHTELGCKLADALAAVKGVD